MDDRIRVGTATAIAVCFAGGAQLAYFYIDLFTSPTIRLIQALVVVASTVAVAALSTIGATRAVRFGDLTAVGIFGLVCLQFLYAYRLLL